MGRSAFTRPGKDKKIRGKIARRKVRNSFLRFLGSTRVVRSFLALFRGSVIAWGVLALMGGFVIFATVSNYFHIKKITIQRDDVFLDVDKVKKSLKDFYGDNLLFLREEILVQHLTEKFPDFRAVEVTEKWPDELELKITLSPPVFNIFNAETANFSVVSADGVILETNVNENLEVLRVFQHDKILKPRQKFMTKAEIENILLAEQLIQDLGIVIDDRHYLSDAWELHLIGPNEMALWLDLRTDIKAQVKKLELAAEKIRLYKRGFEHIDLRVPNQLFWKER